MKASAALYRWLDIILWITCAHSAVVGVGLILLSAKAFTFFGFVPYCERFFPVQGGVFHIVMAVAYALAALSHGTNRALIAFIITAKFMATAFLLIYYVGVEHIWMLLTSAAGDAAFGLAILLAYRQAKKAK